MAANSHVIDDEFIADLEIRFVSADDKHESPVKAELLYEHPERDLAFLAGMTDLKPLRVAKTYAFCAELGPDQRLERGPRSSRSTCASARWLPRLSV